MPHGHDGDDDGFHYYLPNTVDPGSSLMVGAVIACLIGYGIVLPFFVTRNRNREATRKTSKQSKEQGEARRNQRAMEDNNVGNDEVVSVAPSTTSSSSKLSTSSYSTISSSVVAILGQPHVSKSRAARRRRRVRERQLREQLDHSSTDATIHYTLRKGTTQVGGIPPRDGTTSGSSIPFVEIPALDPEGCTKRPAGKALNRTETNVAVGEGSKPSSTLSPSDDKHNLPLPPKPKPKYAEDFDALEDLDKIAVVVSWDIEMRRIVRLCTPFCTQALITGATDIINVAIIGRLIGTREVSAFVIVNLMVSLTSEFVGGLHEALASLCSQAIGANNKKLAGQYCQIVVVLYTLFFLPFMLIWAVYMDGVLRWFGFDEETVAIGKQYTYILVVDLLIDGLGEAVHGLLDVAGFEKFSTLIGATEEILAMVVLLLLALFTEIEGLVTVGLIQGGLGVLFLAINIAIIYRKGWFRPYHEGMIGSFALFNGNAVYLVAKTASSLSLGMLLTDGEWEILAIFASFLGPAEVAAWGILDTIWAGSHELVDGLADAGEVRCALLLGSGNPCRAKVSAYKSMLIGTFAALFLTSFIYMAGEDLPTWLTNDPTLQHLLADLLPLFGLGNLVMALDTMSWTLLGSQGRYRLATVIVCLCSWFVTIPLAAFFSVRLNMNLQGQMAAFIGGYLVMGLIHTYFLLCSNWAKLSEQVKADNEAVRLMLTEEDASKNTSTSASNSSPNKSDLQSLSSSSLPATVRVENIHKTAPAATVHKDSSTVASTPSPATKKVDLQSISSNSLPATALMEYKSIKAPATTVSNRWWERDALSLVQNGENKNTSTIATNSSPTSKKCDSKSASSRSSPATLCVENASKTSAAATSSNCWWDREALPSVHKDENKSSPTIGTNSSPGSKMSHFQSPSSNSLPPTVRKENTCKTAAETITTKWWEREAIPSVHLQARSSERKSSKTVESTRLDINQYLETFHS